MHRAPALILAATAIAAPSAAWADPAPVAGPTTHAAQQGSHEKGEVRAARPGKSRKVRASVGEGGNDLTARLGFQGSGWGTPGVSLEMRALAGPELELAGRGASTYRAAPEILMSLTPDVGIKLVAGGGVGSAYVVDTDSRVRVDDDHVRVTASGVIGAHFRWQRAPIAALLRTEAMSGAGWTAILNLGLQVPGIH
jgi:hypothetical protein